MRVTPVRRSHLGIAALLSLALTATFLAYGTAAPPVAALSAPEPEFLTWDGDPFADDLNHYLVRVGAAEKDELGWLQLSGNDHLVATTPPPGDGVALEDIEHLVAGVAGDQLDVDQILELVETHKKVNSVRPVGFGIYAVSGLITAPELSRIAGISAVTLDTGVAATTVDPYYPTQWALNNDVVSPGPWAHNPDADIDAPEAWHRTRGSGVIVAVIDSGADITHPDLAANIWHNTAEVCGNGTDDDGNGYIDDCSGWDFANHDSSVDDLVGHGTHVAGIVAAEADNGIGIAGVAYEAEVMILKIGDGTPALSAGIEAIAYAIANGARIINASWVVDDPAAAPYLDTALAAAESAGVLFVTGAGNEPVNIDESPVYPAASNLGNVVVVGASTATDDPASWSGYGRENVDLFAPGEFIISTVPGGYGVYSGTSMAAPMVAGAAALLWAATPKATYAEVKGALLDRSDGPNDGVTTFRDLASSDGRLNIERSIYTRLFQPSLMYEFHEFNSFEPALPHKVAITAKTVDPWILPPQTPAMYRVGLYVPVEGQPMAVVGQEITYTGDGGDLTATTDETGRAIIGTEFESQRRSALVQDGDFTPLVLELPAGTYAFVMEVVDVTEPSAPVTMGDPSAVFFIVAEDGSVTAMPQIPLGSDPAPTVSATEAPASTTTEGLPATTTPTTTTTSTTPGAITTTTSQPPSSTTIAASTTTTIAVSTTMPPPEQTTTSTMPATAGSVPPTTAPSTTPSSPTTTTTASPGAPTTTAPIPQDPMIVTSVNPGQGPVSGRTMVTITGNNLPELPDVYFGDRRAKVGSVIAPTFIVVDTPPGAAGFVDVTVVDRATGEQTTYTDGYLYVEEGQDPAPTTTIAPATTTTLGDITPTTVAVTTTIGATTTSTSATPTTSTTLGSQVPDTSLQDWLDSVLRTPEGLSLSPPGGDDLINQLPVELWAGALCDQPICPGWVLER